MIALPGESRFIDVDGLKTHYVTAGKGSPIVLLHGLGASVVTWRDNIGPLSESHTVYALDFPGHGDTDKPDIDYAPDTILRFMVRFLDELRLDRPAVIGNSVGGAVGLMMALRHADRVSRLVLVDSAGLGREISPYIRLVALPLVGNVLESSRVGGSKYMLYNVFWDQKFVTRELLDELYRSRQMTGAKEAVVRTIRRSVNLFGVRPQYIFTRSLGDITSPLLVVWGVQDRIIPVAHARRVAQAAPDVRVEIFDKCGHWPHMEKASTFNSLILDFLSD